MMRIVICEDIKQERIGMEQTINKYILMENYDMELVLSVGDPIEVLDYLDKYPITSGLYFLDVDLQCEMNGIELAVRIKEVDTSATIVFVTTYQELMHLVFTYKVEAMDYITKDRPIEEVRTRTAECMQLAYKRYLDGKHSKTKYFPVKVGAQILNIPHNQILFFETAPDPTRYKRVILHTQTGQIEFRGGAIRELEKIGDEFHCCHKSFVVNITKVKRVDRELREVEMQNGDVIPISTRKMSEFLKALGYTSQS